MKHLPVKLTPPEKSLDAGHAQCPSKEPFTQNLCTKHCDMPSWLGLVESGMTTINVPVSSEGSWHDSFPNSKIIYKMGTDPTNLISSWGFWTQNFHRGENRKKLVLGNSYFKGNWVIWLTPQVTIRPHKGKDHCPPLYLLITHVTGTQLRLFWATQSKTETNSQRQRANWRHQVEEVSGRGQDKVKATKKYILPV